MKIRIRTSCSDSDSDSARCVFSECGIVKSNKSQRDTDFDSRCEVSFRQDGLPVDEFLDDENQQMLQFNLNVYFDLGGSAFLSGGQG